MRDFEYASCWANIHERERRAMRGERPTHVPQWTPLIDNAAMRAALATLEELADAGDNAATRAALVDVQRAIDTLAVAVARDMLGS